MYLLPEFWYRSMRGARAGRIYLGFRLLVVNHPCRWLSFGDSNYFKGPLFRDVTSPPKGKKRVDSNVSPFLVPTLYLSNCYPQSSNSWSKNPAKRHPKKLEVRSFR